MNIPVLIVACLTLFAVIAHVIGGTKETASIAPDTSQPSLVRNWKQAMCAFQLVTIDLIAVTLTLFVLALTDWIAFASQLTLLLSLLYLLWGVIWLVQLAWLKSDGKTYLYLPHWLFFFVCAGLLFVGS